MVGDRVAVFLVAVLSISLQQCGVGLQAQFEISLYEVEDSTEDWRVWGRGTWPSTFIGDSGLVSMCVKG